MQPTMRGSHLPNCRLDPSNNQIVILDALKGYQSSAVCTLKWILISALRTDNVKATSIQEIVILDLPCRQTPIQESPFQRYPSLQSADINKYLC